MTVIAKLTEKLRGSKTQQVKESKESKINYLESEEIVPLRTKRFNAYATELIGIKVYDSPTARQILGTVDNFLLAPVTHTYKFKGLPSHGIEPKKIVETNGEIVGIKMSDSRYSALKPESVYWWFDQKHNEKFAVLKGKPEPEQPLDFAISIGDKIRYGSRKLPLVEATIAGCVFCGLDNVDKFPNTGKFSSEYTSINEVHLDYGDRQQPRRLVSIKRWDMPKAIDFKNKVLLMKPSKLGFRTKEELDKILEDSNTPHEGEREIGGECW